MAKKKTFEEQFSRLEEIVDVLDAGDTPLEEMIKEYEEGMKLAKNLRDFLNKAEQKIIDVSEKNEE